MSKTYTGRFERSIELDKLERQLRKLRDETKVKHDESTPRSKNPRKTDYLYGKSNGTTRAYSRFADWRYETLPSGAETSIEQVEIVECGHCGKQAGIAKPGAGGVRVVCNDCETGMRPTSMSGGSDDA